MYERQDWKPRKVVIVGAGAVGSTFAYALAHSGLADTICLIDPNHELAEGQVLDLAHGLPFFPAVEIYRGEKSDYADAHVIVITAGAKQPEHTTRLDLLQRNVPILEGIVDDVVSHDSHGVMVVVSNPVDVLTYVAYKRCGWPRGRVLGSGTVLDSARLRYLLSRNCDIDVHNVHAYILGEHGDSEFAAWSMTHLAGMTMAEYCTICGRCADWHARRCEIEDSVKQSAYTIIAYKGATYFAIGMALVRIVRAVLRNEKSVLTVSSVLDGEYGLTNVSLGIPSIVSQRGVERVVEANLSPEESEDLLKSAGFLRDVIAQLH